MDHKALAAPSEILDLQDPEGIPDQLELKGQEVFQVKSEQLELLENLEQKVIRVNPDPRDQAVPKEIGDQLVKKDLKETPDRKDQKGQKEALAR